MHPQKPSDPDALKLTPSASAVGGKPDFSDVQSRADTVPGRGGGGAGGKPDFSDVQSHADTVPGGSGGGGAGAQTYTVEKGDTLSHIAQRLRQGQQVARDLRCQPRPARRPRPDQAWTGPQASRRTSDSLLPPFTPEITMTRNTLNVAIAAALFASLALVGCKKKEEAAVTPPPVSDRPHRHRCRLNLHPPRRRR